MDAHELMAQVIGAYDGRRGARADTRIVGSEYRRHYMVGFLRGRSHVEPLFDDEGSADVSFPEWVNEVNREERRR